MRDRLAALLLVPAGVLAGHAVVPALFHDHGAVAHAAFHAHGVQPLLVAVAALAALVGFTRGVVVERARASVLVPAQLAAYAGLELVEVGGRGVALVQEPAFWLGLVVQVLLGAAVASLVSVGHTALGRARPGTRRPLMGVRRAAIVWTRPLLAAPTDLDVRPRRGPPGVPALQAVR